MCADPCQTRPLLRTSPRPAGLTSALWEVWAREAKERIRLSPPRGPSSLRALPGGGFHVPALVFPLGQSAEAAPWPSAESRPHGPPGTAGSAFPLTGPNAGTRRREARQQKHPPRELDRGSGDALSPNTGISGDQALDGRRTLEPGTRTAAAAKTPRGCPAARFPSPGRSGLFAGRSERVEPQRPRRCRPPRGRPAEGNPRSGASRPPAWGQLSELSPSLSLRCVLTPPQAAPAAVTRRRGPGSLDDRRPCTHSPGGRGSEARASRGRPLPGPRSSAGAGRLLRAPSRGHPLRAHPPCRPLLWGGHRPCHVRARSPVVRTLSARSVNITTPTRL